MNCGFCGTHVPDNYTVCTGCHAVYKTESGVGCRSSLPMLMGLIILVLSPMVFMFTTHSPYARIVIIGLGIALVLFGWKRLKYLNKITPRVGKWYRQNP